MSKKRFSEGLNDFMENATVVHHEEFVENKATSEDVKTSSGNSHGHKVGAKKSSGHKNFMTDLSSLFEEANKESQAESNKNNSNKFNLKKNVNRPLSGLDLLIRQTVEENTIELEDVMTRKRVTFTLDNEKFETLKALAKNEKVFLRDIVSKIVDEFLKKESPKN